MPNAIRHQRGTTFSYGGLAKLPSGTWAAASRLRTQAGAVAAELVVTLAPLAEPGPKGETHSILLECAADDTAAWPLGTLTGDILFTDADGVVIPSERITVAIEIGITSAP